MAKRGCESTEVYFSRLPFPALLTNTGTFWCAHFFFHYTSTARSVACGCVFLFFWLVPETANHKPIPKHFIELLFLIFLLSFELWKIIQMDSLSLVLAGADADGGLEMNWRIGWDIYDMIHCAVRIPRFAGRTLP